MGLSSLLWGLGTLSLTRIDSVWLLLVLSAIGSNNLTYMSHWCGGRCFYRRVAVQTDRSVSIPSLPLTHRNYFIYNYTAIRASKYIHQVLQKKSWTIALTGWVLGYFWHSPNMSFCTLWTKLKKKSRYPVQKKKEEWKKTQKLNSKLDMLWRAEVLRLGVCCCLFGPNHTLSSCSVYGGIPVRMADLSRGQRECK